MHVIFRCANRTSWDAWKEWQSKDRWRSKLAHQVALRDGIRLDTLHDARAFVVARLPRRAPSVMGRGEAGQSGSADDMGHRDPRVRTRVSSTRGSSTKMAEETEQ
jgi:hypothetical protein